MKEQIEWIKRVIVLCERCIGGDVPNFLGGGEEQFELLGAQYEEFSEAERRYISCVIAEQLEVQDALFVLSNLIYYIGANEFRGDMLKIAMLGDFGWQIGSLLEYNITSNIKGFYKERRLFHRKNVEDFATVLNVDYLYVPLEQRNDKRIVILADQILHILHAPTKVIMDIAYTLKKYLDYEVLLFELPVCGRIPGVLWWKGGCQMNARCDTESFKLKYRDVIFYGYQIDMEVKDSVKRYDEMLSLIQKWNPVFILNLGGMNPVEDLTARFTTLVTMGMTIECPVSDAQILLRLRKGSDAEEYTYREAGLPNQVQLYMDKQFPYISEREPESYFRSEEGLPEGDFLIAIVGKRLDAEIDEEFVAVMREISERLPSIGFVIIGKVKKIKPMLEKEMPSRNIYYLGFREDLIGSYGLTDMYINPKRQEGGGFSSSMALEAGIPVVTLPNCDVAYNVGEEFTVSNYKEMVDTVCRYASDTEFYAVKQEAVRRSGGKRTQEKMTECVKKIVDDVIDLIRVQEENYAGI